jgi:hypothetical protein
MIMMLSACAGIGGLYLLMLGANWLVDGGSSIVVGNSMGSSLFSIFGILGITVCVPRLCFVIYSFN